MRIGKHVTMICLSLGSWSIAQPVIAQSDRVALDGPIALFEERVTLPNGSATDHALLGDLYLGVPEPPVTSETWSLPSKWPENH